MHERATERLHPAAEGLDLLSDHEILQRLHAGQSEALTSVLGAAREIAEGARLMAETLRAGGALVYAGAGSSALMAMADALELAGTFGLSPQSVRVLMAGGMPTDAEMPGTCEDDTAAGERAGRGIRRGDALVVVTASGATPYACALARAARAKGARTICIANNAGAPVFDHATIAVCLPTPPELVAGSTRMGAGTAQKAALNMMSTLMAIRLGHVHDGLMVNLRADNEKLRRRAVGIVSRISGMPEARADDCLEAASGRVKPAVLLACGATSIDQAEALLSDTQDHLRAALGRL
ncbi:MAG: N-acetylmuramic acid 6-phosphate etherase [Paracoccaceae bacterium]|nr:N-acetylmuramic acid 6-phosphate etherase [Paracoccaceae bacterium]